MTCRGRRSCFFLLLGWLIASLPATSQQVPPLEDTWRWIRFTVEEGLPSNRILDVCETRDGTVWVSTPLGLSWYDGFQFHSASEQSGLPLVRATEIEPDPDGGLWAVIEGRLYYAPQDSKQGVAFSPIPEEFHRQLIKVMEIAPIPGGKVVIRSFAGLDVYDRSAHVLQNLETPIDLKNDSDSRLWGTGTENIWLHTTTRLYRWDGRHWHCHWDPGLDYSLISSLTTDPQTGTRAYFSVERPLSEQGLWVYEGAETLHLQKEATQPQSMDVSNEDELAIVYPSGEFCFRQGDAFGNRSFVPSMTSRPSVVRHRQDGDLWVGTDGGLYLFRRTCSRWSQILDPISWGNDILELLIAKDGTLWKGTTEGVQLVFPNGKSHWIQELFGQRLKIVTGLAQDGQGNIWVSSGSGFVGAYRFDGEHWHPPPDTDHATRPEKFARTYHHRIHIDRAGRPWFCGLRESIREDMAPGDGGVFVYEDGKVSWIDANSPFGPARVYSFGEGLDDDYWFGTSDGLRRFRNGEWKLWPRKAGSTSTSSSQRVRSHVFALAISPEGNPWICHHNGDLGYLDDRGDVHYVDAFGEDRGLLMWDLQFDQEGSLWIGTSEGLSCRREDRWVHFNHRSPVSGIRIWPVTLHHNKLYLGSWGRGVFILDPNTEIDTPPRIEFREPSTGPGRAHVQWTPFAPWGDLNASQVRTRYRLNTEEWTPWTTRHDAQFLDVAPGKHKLQVQAIGYFGNADPLGEILEFHVPAPFYLRASFYLPVGTSLLLLCATSVSLWRRKKQEAENRRSLERELSHSQKMEAIGRLAGGVAHDFNNLLTVILGNLELARSALLDSPCLVRENLDAIDHAGKRAAELTEQLLAFGKRDLHGEDYADVNTVLTDMSPLLRRLVGDGVELRYELQDGVWSVPLPRGQLERIVMNLVVNAHDAMSEGGRVSFQTENTLLREKDSLSQRTEAAPGPYVSLRISDTGCGMDERTLKKIFEPYFTTKALGEGTGLGLSTVHGIVRQAEGHVVVSSEVGVGTTFHVLLPAETSPKDEAPRVDSFPNRGPGRGTLLVCEDDDSVRRFTTETLRQGGYDVLEAQNALDALELVRQHGPTIDLLVTDVVMPGMSGIALQDKIREIAPEVRILFLSGYDLTQEGLPEGVPLLRKPFRGVELIERIHQSLSASENV